jgi:hypothetical protein
MLAMISGKGAPSCLAQPRLFFIPPRHHATKAFGIAGREFFISADYAIKNLRKVNEK